MGDLNPKSAVFDGLLDCLGNTVIFRALQVPEVDVIRAILDESAGDVAFTCVSLEDIQELATEIFGMYGDKTVRDNAVEDLCPLFIHEHCLKRHMTRVFLVYRMYVSVASSVINAETSGTVATSILKCARHIGHVHGFKHLSQLASAALNTLN